MRADIKRREPDRPQLRLSQGRIQQAVFAVLAAAASPLYTRDIHALIQQRLARRISYDTVASCLTVAAKQPTSGVIRVGRGRYRASM
jgi:hypothetical protein